MTEATTDTEELQIVFPLGELDFLLLNEQIHSISDEYSGQHAGPLAKSI